MYFVLSIFLVVSHLSAPSKSTNRACEESLHLVQEGDLIFLDIPNFIFSSIARASEGPTSHVGIAFRNSDKEWVVLESTIPRVRYTDLCTYIERSRDSRHAILRWKSLDVKDLNVLRAEAETRLGIAYDLSFNLFSDRQFCSKLVYESFREALGIEIGEIETLQQVFSGTPTPRFDRWLWLAWFGGRVPWDQATLTPNSQYFDPRLERVRDDWARSEDF